MTMMLNSLGPTMAARKMAKVSAGKREPGVGYAHDHLVDPAAEIAGDDAEQGADAAGDQHGGEADDHRHAGAEDQPRQHIAPDMIGAEQVGHAAAVLPDRRAEAARQAADLRIVRRQQIGEYRRRRR